jgi:hypothetical protein
LIGGKRGFQQRKRLASELLNGQIQNLVLIFTLGLSMPVVGAECG